MSGSEDEEYAYDSDGDEDEASQASDIEATNSGDEMAGTGEGEQKVSTSSSLSAAEGSPPNVSGFGKRRSSPNSSAVAAKKSTLSCADGEVRLLHVSEIVGFMQSKIAQIADLLDLPAAGAAALLRFSGWSQERLTDRYWGDAEKLCKEAGVEHWRKSAGVSAVGTAAFDGTQPGASAHQAGPQAGSQAGGLQSPSKAFVLGLPSGYAGVNLPAPTDAPGSLVTCRICFIDVGPGEALASPCGHFFCSECYSEYLSTKLGEGPAVVYTTCPEHKCTCLAPPELWVAALGEVGPSHSLGTQSEADCAGGGSGGGGVFGATERKDGGALLQKYSRVILEQFVSSSKQMRWCPAPGCERVIMAGAGVANVRCGPGGCGNAFCFKCGEEAHQPSSCDELVTWTEKCQNESETANWILANTKRCPKCNTRIEKNQGCNHMNCSQCKYEFCWMCMGNWTEHGANTGGYYKCNKFDPAATADTDDAAGRAKRELDRYLHYFKRYQSHHNAQLFAEKQLLLTEKRMGELQESTGGSSWIDVQFLKTANEMVIECRRTLKYTYVFGFYLTSPKAMEVEGSAKHRDLFENMQEDLERYTELVSELTELPIEKMTGPETKEGIINNTRVVEKFLINLINGCDEGLDTGYQSSVKFENATSMAAADEDAEVQEAISASLKGKKKK